MRDGIGVRVTITGSCTAASKTEGIYQKWVEKVADREVFISSTLRSGRSLACCAGSACCRGLVSKIPSLNEDVCNGGLVDLMDWTVRGESVLKGKKHATFQFSNLLSASAQIITLSYDSERAPLVQLAISVDFLRPSLFGALNFTSAGDSTSTATAGSQSCFILLYKMNEHPAFDASVFICYHFFSDLLVL
jgi:hypothetical protein